MSERYGMDERERERHGVYEGHFGCHGRTDRAALASRHQDLRLRTLVRKDRVEDSEREAMKREIAELRAVVADLSGVIRRMHAQPPSNTSVLDEMLRSLEAKEPAIKDVEIPKSLVIALSGTYDDD